MHRKALTKTAIARRHEIVKVTLNLIREGGITNVTIPKIGYGIDASYGLIHKYFRDKDDVLNEALRHVSRIVNEEVLRRERAADTPAEQIAAVIDGNFSTVSFTPENVMAWFVFWGQAPFNPALKRMSDSLFKRHSSLMSRIIARALGREARIADGHAFWVFVDGLWLRAALQNCMVSREEYLALAYEYVERQFGIKLPKE